MKAKPSTKAGATTSLGSQVSKVLWECFITGWPRGQAAHLPQAAYSSSKAAIIGLTRDLAQQWTGRKNIRVNALAPGFFESEMTDQYPDGYLDQMMFRVPAGRKGEAEELVRAGIFLASDASSYVTGVLLPVDGGLLTR